MNLTKKELTFIIKLVEEAEERENQSRFILELLWKLLDYKKEQFPRGVKK
jgi:hypothetical protein